jgi:ABC-2 type transport system permease protein
MSITYTVWLREMKRFVRAKSRIIGSLAMPFFLLVFVGIGLNSSFQLQNSSVSYIDFLAPGIIAMTLLFSSIFSGVSVIWDRQFGFL